MISKYNIQVSVFVYVYVSEIFPFLYNLFTQKVASPRSQVRTMQTVVPGHAFFSSLGLAIPILRT